MTALQTIIKEAKSIKKAYPNRFAKWTDYVKQASAIYASKHKGKSPVGKKKAVKKTAKKKLVKKKLTIKKISGSQDYYTRKKEGRVIPRKSTKKIVKKKSVKKPSEKDVLKSITHAVKVQKSHMGIGSVNKLALHKYETLLNEIFKIEKYLRDYTILSKDKGYNVENRKSFKESALKYKKYLSELKTHARELKKHI
jgi:hypothetical protein